MYCTAVDGFYLKANGEVPCWCSPGEHHPILRLDADAVHALAERDLFHDVINGEEHRRMRRELRANRVPFDYCRGCGFLEKDFDGAWDRVDAETGALRSVRMFQVESSYLCNVDCPLCVRIHMRKDSKEPPYQLPFALYKKAVDDLARNGVEVGEVWFSGRGEPLMNPDFAAMVRYAKERLGCRITTHTNSNFKFREELATCGIDELSLSIDGVEQERYERYRRGGKLSKAVRFATDFAEAVERTGSPTRLVWKMVLFDWNSSDADVRRAAEWAQEIGLHEIEFINTDTPGGISFRGTERYHEVKALAEELDRELEIPVRISALTSVYSALPEVEVGDPLLVGRRSGWPSRRAARPRVQPPDGAALVPRHRRPDRRVRR